MDPGERAWIDRQNHMLATGQWAYPGDAPAYLTSIGPAPQHYERPEVTREEFEKAVADAVAGIDATRRPMAEWEVHGRARRQAPWSSGPRGEAPVSPDPLGVGDVLSVEWSGPNPHLNGGRPWWWPVTRFTGAWALHRWDGDLLTSPYGNYQHRYSLWLTANGRIFILAHRAASGPRAPVSGMSVTLPDLHGAHQWVRKPERGRFTYAAWIDAMEGEAFDRVAAEFGIVAALRRFVTRRDHATPVPAGGGPTPARYARLQELVESGRISRDDAAQLAPGKYVSDDAWRTIRALEVGPRG